MTNNVNRIPDGSFAVWSPGRSAVSFVDERSDRIALPQQGYESPSISVDSSSGRWYALSGFLFDVERNTNLRLANLHVLPGSATVDQIGFLSSTAMGGAWGYMNDVYTIHGYDWSDAWVDDAFDPELGDIPPEYLDPNSDCFLDRETGAAVSWYKSFWRAVYINEAMKELIDNDRLGEVMSRIIESLDL